MCDFEQNILKLLLEERNRLKPMVKDTNLPYFKSLDHGIQTAEQNLAKCKEKLCIENVKQNRTVYDITAEGWTQYVAIQQCKKK